MKIFSAPFFKLFLFLFFLLLVSSQFINFSSLKNVLSSTTDLVLIPGNPPELDLEGDYTISINFSNAAQITNDSSVILVDISGKEAEKIAEYSNKYAEGGKIVINSIYPKQVYQSPSYPETRIHYLRFNKVTENNNTF